MHSLQTFSPRHYFLPALPHTPTTPVHVPMTLQHLHMPYTSPAPTSSTRRDPAPQPPAITNPS
ncbi:hypothetical protein E2C01_068907 [Portunus trituberculatus]|uniref:Uncharacterized protein n=1 Tax=Portunus trituberculatus TaxID=210409 RepID=A0A5B7HZ67_PORTR|nr:hypothetical protein [Portunus trituberculatus]